MASTTQTQNVANHARYVPGFHFVTGSLVIANLVWSLYRLSIDRTLNAVDQAVVGGILLGLFLYGRAFAMSVQDRVIRLEERLRFARVLPADLQSRTDEFSADQLIAMRFASDAELPDLARKVLSSGIKNRAEIKAMVKQWRPDYMRA